MRGRYGLIIMVPLAISLRFSQQFNNKGSTIKTLTKSTTSTWFEGKKETIETSNKLTTFESVDD